ncbi:LexA SOS-response transcriptional repressors (RecA-mediated autopeptidases) [uncultured Caudovirales phage]|uniref:LexA SOS-response transcriptional repressors (RecA-mediated autopeptidases) n=1 Tax=uncultured Caudovirales phage TaxID=2100421 RepID=A0A6J7WFF9_9CAUD|nr:LexA SOS-response transcriptional repressors (RecA-mediated autopeptidases) [uncultured Caudovirales phage]CAB5195118.1 LexA SOS-response transcriptional repressors (RecA-mediated autopeptidases) [uncultured Caudovirales phage]
MNYFPTMDLYEARRLVVQRIIDSPRFEGSNAAFANATGISPSYVSRMLKEHGHENRKRIGDDNALKIESALNLRPGEVLHPIASSRAEAHSVPAQPPDQPPGLATISERLKHARKLKGWSQEQLAKAAGVNQSTIGNIESGLRKSPRELLAIAACMEVKPEWLKWGTGELGDGNTTQGPDMRGMVPLVSFVQAGAWDGAIDPMQPGDADEWLLCPRTHSASTYALRVRGESMTAPYGRTYPEGCVIFVDPAQKSPANGARIIARCEGSDEVTFKVFKCEDGRTWLQPLNPTYPVINERFRVLGTVIGKWEEE